MFNVNKNRTWFRSLLPVILSAMLVLSLFRAILLLTCITGWCKVSATLSPSSKGKGKAKEKELNVKIGAISESVFDRNLIDDEPSSKAILIENGAYYEDTSLRNFNGTVLGYVTPVNMTFR